MRYFTALICAAWVVLATATGALAQVAPNPDNPNDVVADALTPPPYGEPVNLETAKKVAAAAVAETQKRNWNAFCIAIVNPSGDLVYFERQDNCHESTTPTRIMPPSDYSKAGAHALPHQAVSWLTGSCVQWLNPWAT